MSGKIITYSAVRIPGATSNNTDYSEAKTKRYIELMVRAVANPNGPRKLREMFLHTWGFPEDWKLLIREEIEFVRESDPAYFAKYLEDDIPF